MEIRQGDVFWVCLDEPKGSEPGYRHPCVIIQNDLFNRSRINTVAVCLITSNCARASAPGNVLLSRGEANLPKSCVVNISQLVTFDKGDLQQKIGRLSNDRVLEIVKGIKLLVEPRDNL